MAGTYDLTEEEIEKVSAYLMELSVKEGSGDVSEIEALRESGSENEDAEEGGEE